MVSAKSKLTKRGNNMIKIEYMVDRKGAEAYGSCICCGKSASDDPKAIAVTFKNNYGQGVVVTLCDECRRELYEKI